MSDETVKCIEHDFDLVPSYTEEGDKVLLCPICTGLVVKNVAS